MVFKINIATLKMSLPNKQVDSATMVLQVHRYSHLYSRENATPEKIGLKNVLLGPLTVC